ncbi:hypothetical protein Y032_0433g1383 [Ancylostoma ceylanicum]|uniref:Reverse transcriptase domain-containing protein n=1 Tax=Ancylostoma ceylanicum TaxID=53326 RepID=A0A016X037_9BILA|nr:hypothetical protein Y032_0433g1383 [Ancylostoma ceylanicum]
MLADFDDACGKVGLQLNLTKTMFMRNGWVPDASFPLKGTTISECSSYEYLGRKVNIMNDLVPEVVDWGAYKSIEDVVKKTKNTRPCITVQHHSILCFNVRLRKLGVCKQDESAISIVLTLHQKVDVRSNLPRVRECWNPKLHFRSKVHVGNPNS